MKLRLPRKFGMYLPQKQSTQISDKSCAPRGPLPTSTLFTLGLEAGVGVLTNGGYCVCVWEPRPGARQDGV